MVRTVVSIVLFVLLIVGCIWIYRIVTHDQVPGGGEVMVRSNSEHDQNGVRDDLHRPTSRSKHTRHLRAAMLAGTINTEPVADYGKPTSNSVETTQYGPGTNNAITQPQPYNNKPFAPAFPQQSYAQGRPDLYSGGGYNDSLPPNAPNGVGFSGTGAYQWYRQGDLTWRVDSKSGASCVDYATMEEWSKPIVYTHGCGRSGSWRRHHARG